NCRVGEHLVTSAGSYGRMMTRVTLDIDRSSDRIVNTSATNEIVTRDVARDPGVTRIVEKYRRLAETRAQVRVGNVTAELVRRENDAGESALGDVIADAQLAATRAPERGGAVVAFMNGGGVRADISARPGGVTYRDLFAVQPFGNTLTVFTLTGDMLKRLLE